VFLRERIAHARERPRPAGPSEQCCWSVARSLKIAGVVDEHVQDISHGSNVEDGLARRGMRTQNRPPTTMHRAFHRIRRVQRVQRGFRRGSSESRVEDF